MQLDPLPSDVPSNLQVIPRALRQYPLLRSVTYGLTIRVVTMACSYAVSPVGGQAWSMSHSLAFNTVATPFVVGLTYSFVRLNAEDKGWVKQVLFTHPARWLFAGIALGSGAYLGLVGVVTSLGWVHFPEWGWQTSSKAAVSSTLFTHMANILLAFNEEMLYRGYGLHSLAQATGTLGAVTFLIPYFAWGHGSDWKVLFGQGALALATTALRFAGNSLWLPIGYHAAWNYMQTAVFGAPDAAPSIRPMHVEGPTLWIGRPGYPEPGLLMAIANLVVTGGALYVWWRRRRKANV